MRLLLLVAFVLLAAGVALVADAVAQGGADVWLVVVVPVISGSSAEFLLGVVALVAGLLLLPFGLAERVGGERPFPPDEPGRPLPPSEGSSGAGGLVLVGPVPIFFGSWRNVSARTRLWVAVAGALVLVVFLVGLWVAVR